jgi:two-component system, OmpR family, alkaline phosphatase synthesis response regulator PhoP
VLVIDDDDAVRKSVLRLLLAHGHHAFGACDGKEGLTLALLHAPDVIIVDMHMPGQNGIDVAHSFRCHAQLARTPLIALSATAEDIEGNEIFCATLSKPCSSADLLAAVLTAAAQPRG